MIPKTLLFASTSYAGMGPYVASIVNSFEPEDNVRFFLIEREDKYYSKNIKKDLLPLCTIVKEPKPSKLRTLYQIAIDGSNPFGRQIKKLYKKENIKVVHDMTSCSDVALIKYFSEHGKLLYTVHDIYPHESKKAFYKQWRQDVLYKRIFKAIDICDYLYTNSLSQKKLVEIRYPSKICHYSPFPSLVTDEVANGTIIPPELKYVDRYILFFGRIEAYKGLDILIKAYLQSGLGDSIKLVIAGKGEFENDYNNDNIIFINRYIDDREVAPLYKNAICAVYPYISATQSGVISVATYFGTPVIASNVEFFKETLGEDYKYLFKVSDYDQLSRQLKEIVNNETNTLSDTMKKIYQEKYESEVSRNGLKEIYSNIENGNYGHI